MAERFRIGEVVAPQGIKVPESLTRKIERNVSLLKKKGEAIAVRKSTNKKLRHDLKMRATKYAKNYRSEERTLISLRRQAKLAGNYFAEPEAKMMLIIRITGINKLAPKPRKILKLLRLDQLHKAVFIKCTKPMMNMLKCIQPYVICGYPNQKTTRDLIMKRGYAKVNGQRKAIHSNEVISDNLGKFGIHGIDDLINEIFTVGPNFKQANNFLWAFKLSSPNGGFVLKKHGFHEPKGGDWGNREELINPFVRRMF